MRCDACFGSGWAALGSDPLVCPECNGSGVAYCCDKVGEGDLTKCVPLGSFSLRMLEQAIFTAP